MNLTITQDNTRTETINSSIIDKLYEIAFAASSDPNSTVSLTGRLESPKGYKFKIDWLNTNFSPDLTITVPSSGLYILFTDPEVLNVLKTSIGDGEGVAESALTSTTTTNSLGLANNTSITDFREGCLFTEITSSSTNFVNGCTSLTTLGIPPAITYAPSGLIGNAPISKFIIKNWNNWINTEWNGTNFTAVSSGYLFYDMDNVGNISLITHLVLPEGCNFNTGANVDKRLAFRLSGLQEVTLPTSMTNIGVFEDSSLKYLHFANGAEPTSIHERAFNNCTNLEFDVSNLPTSITTLGYHCFYGCSKITGSINLPNVTFVPTEAFKNCTSLNGTLTLPNVTTISSGAFDGCSNLTGTLNLPNLTSLGNKSFIETKITGITDLGSVTAIPELCFQTCTSLTSVVLPSTCKTLGKYAFAGDAALTTINLSDINRFGLLCFRNAGISGTLDLTNATIMEPYPFYKSLITKIIIPASTANNMTFIDTSNWLNLQSSGLGSAFTGMSSLTTIETDVEDWTVPFITRGCPNLQPFVIYQPLLTQTPLGVIGGGYHVDLLWSNKSLWTLAYYPALTDCRHTGYYVNNYRDNGGIMTLGQGTLILDLLYLKNVLDIDNAIFINLLANIVLNSTTVPNVWSHGQNSTTRTASTYFRGELDSASTLIDIYVPDSAVNDYKTAWPNHVDHIFGISSLNQGVIYATEADWAAANKPVGLIAEYLGLSSADLATFMTANNLTYWTNPNA